MNEMPTWFKAWFAFCAVLSLVVLAAIGWAGYELITWLTRK